jgi:hypothetical protein
MEEMPSRNMPVQRLKLAILPLDLFALLCDCNPFRGNSNYWQVTQEETRQIIPISVLDEVKLTCLYVSHEDTMENGSAYSSILFQPGQWMMVNLELEKLAVLTPRKKRPYLVEWLEGPRTGLDSADKRKYNLPRSFLEPKPHWSASWPVA